MDAVTAIRRLRQSRDEGEALAHAEEAFSEEELDQLRAAFAEADVDGRGEVAGRHLGTVLAHLVSPRHRAHVHTRAHAIAALLAGD